MQVNGAYSTTGSNSAQTRKTGDSLGKDDFLNLLVTQLKYQDPLNPMEDKEFIAQMAQFTTLEQMQNLTQVSQMQQATGMIDKNVKAEVFDSNGVTELVYGRVTSVRQSSGELYLTLQDGREIKMSEVKSVLGATGLVQEAMGLVGHKVYMRDYNNLGQVIGIHQVKLVDAQQDSETGILKLIGDDGNRYNLEDVWNVLPDDETVNEE